MKPALAILAREWRAYFNSPVAYVFLVIFLMLTSFFTFNVSRFYEAGQASLDRFFFWHPWLYLVLVPAVAMRLWAEERRAGTLELLLTLPVTTAQAVLGKFLAAWLFVLLALALTFPVVITAFYLGDPDPGPIVTGYLGSALLAGAYLSVGALTSALTRNQVISFILAAVIGLFLLLAGFSPVTDLLHAVAPSWLVAVIAGFSFTTHYEQMQRGIIDARDLIYFASVIAFMLLATNVALNNRKTK
ncbi:MAG: ABC transporter permease subunit [Kiritimatiellae bacterium]|nr:ABC transporter permease subunit [Kiritimatiellia bacterium]MDW8459069.1 ABC transporter permease [Verrucomicrobiota bacterium]